MVLIEPLKFYQLLLLIIWVICGIVVCITVFTENFEKAGEYLWFAVIATAVYFLFIN